MCEERTRRDGEYEYMGSVQSVSVRSETDSLGYSFVHLPIKHAHQALGTHKRFRHGSYLQGAQKLGCV